jgi:hypothetical protein
MSKQSTQSLLMVRPTTFAFDSETAISNAFQHESPLSDNELRVKALQEFDESVEKLRTHGIDVTVFEDPENQDKPDAVFPNNWLSTWQDGHIFLYPMATESRRRERSEVALKLLRDKFKTTELIDLSAFENEGKYLESTGVIIFDHTNKLAYGSLSIRCDEALFTEHVKALGYTPIVFHSYDPTGMPIYHTNVLMGVQTETAVICLDAITDEQEKEMVVKNLEGTGHSIIAITYSQMQSFCGNVLEVQNNKSERFLILSQTAYNAFSQEQRDTLSKDKQLLPITIPTIETIGGGSARCMLAEIYLPKR